MAAPASFPRRNEAFGPSPAPPKRLLVPAQRATNPNDPSWHPNAYQRPALRYNHTTPEPRPLRNAAKRFPRARAA